MDSNYPHKFNQFINQDEKELSLVIENETDEKQRLLSELMKAKVRTLK